jgi:hypothetical protein
VRSKHEERLELEWEMCVPTTNLRLPSLPCFVDGREKREENELPKIHHDVRMVANENMNKNGMGISPWLVCQEK